MVEKQSANAISYLIVAVYCAFTVLAFLWVVSVSLKSQNEFFSSSIWSLPSLYQWSNYKDAWVTGHIGRFFFNSTYVTIVATAGCLLVSSLSAYVLARVKFRGKELARAFLLFGIALPPFLIVIPLFTILLKLHLLNSLNGLVLVYITIQIPFNVFVLTSFYKNIPLEFEEAAAIDGASPFVTFLKIMIPFTYPVVIACAIINILSYWNEFLFALVFLGDKEKLTLPIGLFNLNLNAIQTSNYPTMFAGIFLSSIPLLVLFGLFQKQFTKGISQGGIKM